jgi:outer membrane protein assembly factor BamB
MKHSYHFFIGHLILLICFSSCRNDDETTELNNQLNLNAYITFTNVNGVYEKGVPLDETNYIELHIYALEGGNYNFSSKNTNGYQFKGSGTIESEGDHIIELYGEGTPEVKQVDSVRIETDSSSKTLAINIAENLSNRVIITSAATDAFNNEYKVMALNGRGDILWEYPGLATENYVNDGVVYIDIEGILKAIDLISGIILWEESSVTSVRHILESDGKLYVGTYSDYFILESSTGTIISQGKYPSSSTTQIINDKIIFSTSSRVVAADKNTGDVLWENGYSLDGRPTVVMNNVICTSYNGLFALNIENGELVWETNLRTLASPAYDGSNLIVSSAFQFIYKIDPNTGAILWEASLEDLYGSPEIYGDMVFATKDFGFDIIHGYDINTGEEVWDRSPFGFLRSEMIAHENIVFLGTNYSLFGFDVETGNTEVRIGIPTNNDPMTLSYEFLLSITNVDNMNTAYPGSMANQ